MRVLYCTGGGVGNVVMSTPAISALAEMGYEVDILVGHDSPPGVEDLLRPWPSGLALQRSLPGNVSSYDACVHSVWHRKRLSGCDEVFAPSMEVVLRATHEIDANMVPVRNLGCTGPTPAPHVEVRDPVVPKFGRPEEQGGYVVFAPQCKPEEFWRRKLWDGWLGLYAKMPWPVVALGDRPEGSFCADFNLTGETSLAEAAAVIRSAGAVVAIDNGLAHVAAALGVPTVVLFGATSEVKNRPLGPGPVKVLTKDLPCRPCQMTSRWESCADWRCMGFEPEEVAEAVRQLLHHGGAEETNGRG